MLLEEFNYHLPVELIATEQIKPRDHAKLLVLKNHHPETFLIKDFINFVEEGDLVVLNDTKVIPAKLETITEKGKISLNLHKMITHTKWLAFTKPAHKINIDQKLIFGEDFYAMVLDKNYGELTLQFNNCNFLEKLNKYGKIPLPPYIEKQVGIREQDKEDYQTIYAKYLGSTAAPTAGLHFTKELLDQLKAKNVKIEYLTLHVGAGTFLPVKVEKIDDHKMHSEYGIISQETVDTIIQTKQNGKKIIAVGTTSARLLEAACLDSGNIKPFHGETDIFIRPGYNFKIVDMLMTNFHLPKSTLLMLVSAFAGYDSIIAAYNYAVNQRFRFYSYGDAMLLYRKT